MLVRTHDNVAWIGLFNGSTMSPNSGPELEAALWDAYMAVTEFPTHDLFSTFE